MYHVPGEIGVETHPHLYRFWNAHGRPPCWAEQWGGTSSLRKGRPADRLRRACPDLRVVRWHQTRSFAHDLDRVPAEKVLPTLTWLVEESRFKPSLGVICPEWSRGAGWHWHALLSPPDAELLLEAEADGLGGVYVDPDPVENMLNALAYLNKRVKKSAPEDEQFEAAERLLAIRAATGKKTLRLMRFYGV